MAEKRPYFHASTAELEEIFKNNKKDSSTLKKLIQELTHRKRPRARALHEKISNFLASENIDLESEKTEVPQQLSLYPPPPKKRSRKKKPESPPLLPENVLPGSPDGPEGHAETTDEPPADPDLAQKEKSENPDINGAVQTEPERTSPRRHSINLEKATDRSAKTAPTTNETFWGFLLRLLTGKNQNS